MSTVNEGAMAFHVMHRLGNMESDPPLDSLAELLAELDPADTEHVDVAVEHESGWYLSARIGGHVVWEDVEEGGPPPRHMTRVPAAKILELWTRLAQGDLAAIEAEPWRPGYGP